MLFALCTPATRGKSIGLWDRLLRDAGHQTVFVERPELINDQIRHADAAIYYGMRPDWCKGDELEAALAARNALHAAGVRVVNPPDVWCLALDKRAAGRRFIEAGLAYPPDPYPGDRTVVKPRYGTQGVGVEVNLPYEEGRVKWEADPEELIWQRYVPGRLIRVVADCERALFAYEKVSDTAVASISQGAERRFVELDAALAKSAVAAVRSVGGDLMGVDVILAEHNVILEVNTGFALYAEDGLLHSMLVETVERLVDAE